MKVCVLTSNQPRHLSLVERLSGIADEVVVLQGANTLFPGQEAGFFRRSEVMQKYFHRVLLAEEALFGTPRFLPPNVRQLVMRSGDVNLLSTEVLAEALDADVFVVFGAAYIRPPLVDLLIERRAYNLHMGVSPYYRGSSCNFWALQDGRPEYVGATIHLLSRGLDSGPMLFHALPPAIDTDGFMLGMMAVAAAQDGLCHALMDGTLPNMIPVPQDRNQELRYSRNSQFTDDVASAYLADMAEPSEIGKCLRLRDLSSFLRPFIGQRVCR